MLFPRYCYVVQAFVYAAAGGWFLGDKPFLSVVFIFLGFANAAEVITAWDKENADTVNEGTSK